MCGSCWTFSAVSVLESSYAIKYGELANWNLSNLILIINLLHQFLILELLIELEKFFFEINSSY
jgi:hypothetical protein